MDVSFSRAVPYLCFFTPKNRIFCHLSHYSLRSAPQQRVRRIAPIRDTKSHISLFRNSVLRVLPRNGVAVHCVGEAGSCCVSYHSRTERSRCLANIAGVLCNARHLPTSSLPSARGSCTGPSTMVLPYGLRIPASADLPPSPPTFCHKDGVASP